MPQPIDNTQLELFIDELKKSSGKNNPDNNGLEVLIIDDDRWMHKIIAQFLHEVGLNTKSSFDAYDGIANAVESSPILIFLDILMPEVKGDALLKMLKKIKTTKDIPVIIMSGNLNKEVLANTFRNGASGFISKPFTKELVFTKVKECLKGKSKTKSNQPF
jgi:PleD family two-component response regulator